jgi:paraquat-inducible protein B
MAAPPPQATLRRRRSLTLVWIIPLAALGIVVWLGVQSLLGRGPTVEITFLSADGVEAGHTPIRHKSVDIGVVERVALAPDLNHVVVTARMDRRIARNVTEDAEFWVVRPRLSAGGISGLSTLISGSYIEMQPGTKGSPQDRFTGLENPPAIEAGQSGSSFVLTAADLGSLGQGSPVYLRGVEVGQVQSGTLEHDGTSVDVHIFVNAPFDRMVHPDSRFWNVSGLSVTAGASGVRANTESLQALIMGGIAFDVPDKEPGVAPSPAGSRFKLYPDESSAHADPYGQQILFLVNFPGPVHGLAAGAPVELKGVGVGQVTEVHLDYDAATGELTTPAVIEVDPDDIGTLSRDAPAGADLQPVVEAAMEKLVQEGVRARLSTGNLLTGQRVVSLEMDPDAKPAGLKLGGVHPEIPAETSGDLDSLMHVATGLMKKLGNVADHLDKLTGSPELTRSLQSLQKSLDNVEKLTAMANTELPPLVHSLRDTADAATKTLQSADRTLGNGAGGGDLPGMLHELTEAARSIRSLADFLDEHPEALLRGRTAEAQ